MSNVSLARRMPGMRAVLSLSVATLCTAPMSFANAQAGPPPGAPVRNMAVPPMAAEALSRKVHDLAAALAAQEQFSGVVLLAQQGRPVLQEAFGVADRDARTPMAVGTILNVSSVGKLFTQIAVGQLVAAGKLSLDSTIAVYWPDYPDATAARTVTIRHLLTHRSGIDGNIFAAPMMVRTNRDYVPLVTKGPLAFAPGTQQRYSNAGYVVLGEIIQRVSGEVYHEYIQRHVFGPAGMSASGFPARDSLPTQAARGYTRGLNPRAPRPAVLPPLTATASMEPRRGSAAGGAYANVGDLLRFVLARRTGSLGVPAQQRQDISAGGTPGSNAVIAEGLPGGYDLIVLSNFDPPVAEMMADSVEAWLGSRGGGPGAERVGGPQRVMLAPGGPGDLPPVASGPMQTTMPDTPQGRVATGYLRAFASRDTATMRAFIAASMTQDSRTLDERVRRYQDVLADMGTLTFVGVRVASATSYAVQVNSSLQGPLTLLMSFEPVAPNRLIGIQFLMERRAP